MDGTEIVSGDSHIPFIDGSVAIALQNKRMTIETVDEKLVIDVPSMQMPRSTVAWLWIAQSKYRPGDKIRGFIVARERLNPYVMALRRLPKAEGQVHLVDKGGSIVIARPFEYGGPVASSFEIDTSEKEHLDLGKCMVELVDKDGSKLASAPVEITDFKKKELSIVVDHPSWVLEGDDIELSISGKYYHGSNVLSGKVSISIDGKEPDELHLDESGVSTFTTTSGKKGAKTFKVTLVDKDGLQDETTIPVIIADKPAILSFIMPPPPVYSTVPFTVRVKAETPDGIPIPSMPIGMSLSRVSKMTGDRIPADKATVSTSVNGLATFKMTSKLDGSFELSAACSASGFDISAPSSLQVNRFLENDVVITNEADAATVKEGDPISGKIKIHGLPETIKKITSGFIDLVTDKIVESIRVEIVGGETKYSFKGITDFWGTAGIDFYTKPSKFGIETLTRDVDVAAFMHAKQTVVIEPGTPLSITARVDMPGEATTGSEITARVTIDSTLLRDEVHVFGALVDQRVPTAHEPGNIGKTFIEATPSMEVTLKYSEAKYRAMPQSHYFFGMGGGGLLGSALPPGGGPMYHVTSYAASPPGMGGGPEHTVSNFVGTGDTMSFNRISKGMKRRNGGNARGAGYAPMPEEDGDKLIADFMGGGYEITERDNFAESVMIAPVKLKDGEAVLKFKLPDSITRYSLVLFVAGTMQFGEAKGSIVAKNPVFASIVNPASITLQDDIATIRAVIRNETKAAITSATVKLHGLDGIDVIGGNSPVLLKDLKPLGSANASWLVRGIKVGMAKAKVDLLTPGFAERVALDQPLRVRPPGIPVIVKKPVALSEKIPIKEVIFVSENAAHSDVIISILPSLEVAIIDGMESLAEYPHGCCEQTVASTLPNLIVHGYLKAAGKLTDAMGAKLVKNMQAGFDRLMGYHNSDGGFSYWGHESTPFYTALAISAIAQIKQHVKNVPPDLFTAARDYLDRCKEGSHWNSRAHGHATFAPVIMDDVAATAFIVHALAEAGIDIGSSFSWLLDRALKSSDPATVALTLRSWALVPAHEKLHPDAGESLGKVLLSLVSDDGWEGVSWKGGSALTGAVESTAYAVLALVAAFPDDATKQGIIGRAIKYLLDCRSSSGFGSTRDTLYAAMAISTACSGEKPDFSMRVMLNGKEIKADRITPENVSWKVYDIRSMHVDGLAIGKNTIEVTIEGKGKCHATIEQRTYFHERSESADRVSITVPEKAREGEAFEMAVEIVPVSPMQSVMVNVPVPSIARLPPDIIQSILRSGSEHAEVKDGTIHVFFERVDKGKKFSIPLVASLPGEARVDAVASEMYSSRKAIAAPSTIRVE
jgi:hypothetical protein